MNFLSRLFRRSNPGHDLAQIGIEKHRAMVRERAREICRLRGLPVPPALAEENDGRDR